MKIIRQGALITILVILMNLTGAALPAAASLPANQILLEPAIEVETSGIATASSNDIPPAQDDQETKPGETSGKIDPLLHELANSNSSQEVLVTITAEAGLDFSSYGRVIAQTVPDPLELVGYVVAIPASRIYKVAGRADVTMVSTTSEKPVPTFNDPDNPPLAQHAAVDPGELNFSDFKTGHAGAQAITSPAIDGPEPTRPAEVSSPQTPDSWFENDYQGVNDTWQMGVTGNGVKYGVVDSGVDFCNPALLGRWAVQNSFLTPRYNGWPIAYDDRSALDFLGNYPNVGSGFGGNYGWYVRTQPTSATVFTDPLYGKVYTVDTSITTSQSGVYRWGYHPDSLWHLLSDQASLVVLAVDSVVPGRYDQVWFDANWDGTFDSMINKNTPAACVDWISPSGYIPDGVADDTLGLLYWISDGASRLPGVSAVYDNTPVPASGEILMFMISDILMSGGDHGTLAASSGAGYDNGLLLDNGFLPDWYTGQSIVSGPGSGGAYGTGADIIPIGNIFAGGSEYASYLFSVLGYDSIFGTGDEPSVASLTYGSASEDADAWDALSTYLSAMNLTLDLIGLNSPLYVTAAGDGGPGYGTVNSPGPVTGLAVGASTQYGPDLGWGPWEGVSSPDRAVYGDVQPSSDRGPGGMSNLTPHLVANGAWGTGAVPVNLATYLDYQDGTQAWALWGGTGRSAPVVAGMSALVFDAYRQGRGSSPSFSTVRRYMLTTAIDIDYDEFVGGAGLASPYAASLLALRNWGVSISPGDYAAGDFEGNQWENFTKGLFPGQTDQVQFSVRNPTNQPVTVSLHDEQLQKVNQYTLTVSTNDQGQRLSNYSYGAPDYIADLTGLIQANAAADLMVVRFTYPFEFFDDTAMPPTPPTVANRFIGLVYNVYDDGDNTWWTDADADGRVDITPAPMYGGELDTGDEYIRFAYAYNRSTQQEVRVQHPYDRMGSGGVWAGLTRNTNSGADVAVSLEVTFYSQQDWSALTLSTNTLSLGAGATGYFTANIQAAANAAPGAYTGRIVAEVPMQTGNYPLHIPVVLNVYARLNPAIPAPVFGGTTPALTPYDNGQVNGAFSWNGSAETGDWRIYQMVVEGTSPQDLMIIDTQWQDYPTDVDTLVLDPVENWYYGFPFNFNFLWSPYTQDYRGDGSTRYGARPNWQFYTSVAGTGGTQTQDISIASAESGLHTVMQHATLFGGEMTSVPFRSTIGTWSFSPDPLLFPDLPGDSTNQLTFSSNMHLDSSLVLGGAYGWYQPLLSRPNVYQDNRNDPYDQPSVVLPLAVADTYRLEVKIGNSHFASDVDLYVMQDVNNNNSLDNGDPIIASSTGSSSNESITLRAPADGNYLVVLHGWWVSGNPGAVDLSIKKIAGSNAMQVTNLPQTIDAFTDYLLDVTVTRPPLDPGANWEGLLLFGTPQNPTAFEVRVVAGLLGNIPVTLRYHDVEDVVPVGTDLYVEFTKGIAGTVLMSHDPGYSLFTTSFTLNTTEIEYRYLFQSIFEGQPEWRRNALNAENRWKIINSSPYVAEDYRSAVVEHADIWNPQAAETTPTTYPVSARVHVPDASKYPGADPGVRMELGYGTSLDLNTWTWVPMTYAGQDLTYPWDDLYSANVTGQGLHTYYYAVRADPNPGNPLGGWSYVDNSGVDLFDGFDPMQVGWVYFAWKLLLPLIFR